jgi:hypothetical protein
MAVARVGQADCWDNGPTEDCADEDENLKRVSCMNCKPNASSPATARLLLGDAWGTFERTVSVRSHASQALRTAEAVIWRDRIRGFRGRRKRIEKLQGRTIQTGEIKDPQ